MRSLIKNLRVVLILLVILAVALIAGLMFQQERSQQRIAAAGENRVSLAQRYQTAGQIVSSDGSILATSESGVRTYAEDPDLQKAVMPLVGDYTHIMTNTVEARYQDILLGSDRGFGRQFFLDVVGKGLGGDDIHLTLDGELTKQAYSLLGERRGAVAMLNYETGQIVALASTPSASAEDIIRFDGLEDGALFNRALLGAYAPGSTFKALTALAWIDSPMYDPALTVDCTGESTVGPTGARDHSAHGTVDLNRAMRLSCNVFFGEISQRVGGDHLLSYYEQMGLTGSKQLGRIDVLDTLFQTPTQEPEQVSWFAIGQPSGDNRIRISPLELASAMGTFANGGRRAVPYLIDHFEDPLGRSYLEARGETRQVISERTADIMEKLLIDAVSGEGAGGVAAQVSGLTIGGKTGTPEVEGQENFNAFFAGFIQNEAFPYAIAVVVENVGYGATHAAPIAHELFATVLNRGQ